ncbi:hypothetical protein O6H91_02G126000 [Diphasiastrum complanatum]|uniref:Uncharacterized protein n=1 Tax=Diphasiastrum complanatum TaxID=34168 RepID=A0ACC2EKI6_DIPCM|nr:hypothetical protein O6H91_Y194200 [Diphasiastrum complanatum]KAJ7566966.1 hypothetical protein O6H91_02G126000 [Diphasiastrum complanatum]
MASESHTEAFMELQGRLVETNAKLKQVQMQIRNKESERRRASLTFEELDRLPSDTNTYKSVGKSFILEPRSILLKEQLEKVEECDNALSTLTTSKEYLEKQMQEVESNFKELLQQSPSLANQVMAMSVT